MKSLTVAFVLLLSSFISAQTTTYIYDSTGNVTTAQRNGDHIYLYDSKGNTTTATVNNGNVYMNSSNGQYTFGTVKGGNVFLTDNKGVTTGTIKNGNIFLNNSDGSLTTGSYNTYSGTTYINTTTTGIPQQQPQQPICDSQCQQARQEQIQKQQQQDYAAGYAMGQALGMGIGALIHKARWKQEGFYEIRKNEFIASQDARAATTLICEKKKDGSTGKCRTVKQPFSEQYYNMMNALRQTILSVDPNNPALPQAINLFADDVTSYCQMGRQEFGARLRYTDLLGKQQSCP